MHLLDTGGLWPAADYRVPVTHWKPILGVSLKRDGNECHWLFPTPKTLLAIAFGRN